VFTDFPSDCRPHANQTRIVSTSGLTLDIAATGSVHETERWRPDARTIDPARAAVPHANDHLGGIGASGNAGMA
jgi:hypothetical protein